MMIKNFKNIVIAVFVFVNSAAFAQYNPENNTYTLQDSDVVVENGVIMSCSTDASDWGTGNLIIPEELDGQVVKAIDDVGFFNGVFVNKQITQISLNKSLVKIGSDAFKENQIKEVTIPSKVTIIGANAFAYNKLISVEFEPYSLIRVIDGAFVQNSQLEGINLPVNVNPGFKGYKKMIHRLETEAISGRYTEPRGVIIADLPAYVVTPLDVELINGEITSFYAGYGKVIIPEYIDNALITKLGEWIQIGSYLEDLILPNSLDTIRNWALFEYNTDLFILPQNVSYIADGGIFDHEIDSLVYAESTSLKYIGEGGLSWGIALPEQVINEGSVFSHWEDSRGNKTDSLEDSHRHHEAQFTPVTAYDISGSITIDNITGTSLILDGDFEGTRYPDSDGNFEFLLNEGRTMTLTPKKEGYVFTPENREISNLSSDLDELHFTAEKSENIISGKIDIDDASDIYLQISGDYYAAVKVNDDGTYAFPVNEGRNIKIMPLKDGYTFMPESIDIENASGAISENNFKTVESSYTLSGSVGIDEVGDLVIKAGGDMNKTISVGSDGRFSFQGYSNVSVIITPEKAGYTFSPESITINPVEEEVNGVSFTSHRKSFSVSGTINLASIDGVELEVSGDTSFVQQLDADGNFEFSLLARKNITIAPTKEGIVFSPESITITDIKADEDGNDFTINLQTATSEIVSETVLSPNPTEGLLTISAEETIKSVFVFSQTGKLLFTEKADALNYTLDLSLYADGTYYIQIKTLNNLYKQVVSKK